MGGREGAAVLAWLPAGWSSGGAGLWPSWDELGGLGVALCFIFIVSPPPASFPCNAFLSVICGEGDRGKGGSNGGSGEGTGCQGEGLSSFP